MKYLVENGADINAVDGKGKTPLHLCCRLLRNPSAVKLLLDHGADVTIQDKNQNTPLIILTKWQRPKELHESEGVLLVEVSGTFVEKPLYSADFKAHYQIAELIIQTICNNTAAAAASTSSSKSKKKKNHGRKKKITALDICDAEGKTALHWAVIHRHKEIAVQLIKEGADSTKKDKQGFTPFVVCEESLYPAEIRQILLKAIEGNLHIQSINIMNDFLISFTNLFFFFKNVQNF